MTFHGGVGFRNLVEKLENLSSKTIKSLSYSFNLDMMGSYYIL